MIRYWVIAVSAITAPISTIHPCEHLAAEKAWVRQAPPGHTHLAAYMRLTNVGHEPLRITGIQSPDFESAMLHETVYTDGQARMRHIPAIDLKPGAVFVAKPGGAHVMLTGPKQPVNAGTWVTLSLECSAHGSLTISLPVRKSGFD